MTAEIATRNHLRVAVRAAGGLIIRRGADGAPRVALVHRPLRDDWAFPKGEQRRGESLLASALRSVRDATGFMCTADVVAGITDYVDERGRPKLVQYWVMKRITGTFQLNPEVDALAWVRPAEAALRLSSEHDRCLLTRSGVLLESVLDRREHAETLSLG